MKNIVKILIALFMLSLMPEGIVAANNGRVKTTQVCGPQKKKATKKYPKKHKKVKKTKKVCKKAAPAKKPNPSKPCAKRK